MTVMKLAWSGSRVAMFCLAVLPLSAAASGVAGPFGTMPASDLGVRDNILKQGSDRANQQTYAIATSQSLSHDGLFNQVELPPACFVSLAEVRQTDVRRWTAA